MFGARRARVGFGEYEAMSRGRPAQIEPADLNCSIRRLTAFNVELDNSCPVRLGADSSLMINSDLLVEWRPFFLMVAGASASLAGLLFVALSLHLRHIATLPLYRYRARLSLSCVVSVMVIASLVLIPRQSALSLGMMEFFPLAIMIALIVLGLLELRKTAEAKRRPYVIRTLIGLALVIVACVGNIILAAGRPVGLEILASCCLLFLVWMVINAWALVVGLADETSQPQTR